MAFAHRFERPGEGPRQRVAVAASIGLAAVFLFVASPGIDIALSRVFFAPDRTFAFSDWRPALLLREAFSLLFFAFGLLAEVSWRRRLIVAGVAAGSLAGLVRIGQGAHFASDVVFAGVIMMLAAQGLHAIVFRAGAHWFAANGPLHRRLSDTADGAVALAVRWARSVHRILRPAPRIG